MRLSSWLESAQPYAVSSESNLKEEEEEEGMLDLCLGTLVAMGFTGAKHKMANCHSPSRHHNVILIRFGPKRTD